MNIVDRVSFFARTAGCYDGVSHSTGTVSNCLGDTARTCQGFPGTRVVDWLTVQGHTAVWLRRRPIHPVKPAFVLGLPI
ncbi:MAG: hypothetical protein JXA30_05245 [Deltaproteobacteria bacterium]|nr:hypothetical protein [Deltaproteobacteria bacterium]